MGSMVYGACKFQSTLPRGERLRSAGNGFAPCTFQSTLPRGERQTQTIRDCRCTKFQSTLPRGERRQKWHEPQNLHDFNPRSHEGSDAQLAQCCCNTRISIHAPTRGATSMHDRASVHFRFQSTLPRGERLHSVKLPYIGFLISIHAPTRGATRISWKKQGIVIFQSTLPRGERH